MNDYNILECPKNLSVIRIFFNIEIIWANNILSIENTQPRHEKKFM